MPYEVIEHTADLKIRAWGSSLENLFSEAVLAMMSISLRNTKKYEYTKSSIREIEIEAPDVTALLVDFLSEVLALSQTNKEVYTELKFKEFSPSTNSGQTKLFAVLFGVKVEVFDEDIKAVTYHEADVHQNEKGEWETLIVFDI